MCPIALPTYGQLPTFEKKYGAVVTKLDGLLPTYVAICPLLEK